VDTVEMSGVAVGDDVAGAATEVDAENFKDRW